MGNRNPEEYMRKGFALDDERLKNLVGGRYFKKLLERIQSIASLRCAGGYVSQATHIETVSLLVKE